MKKCLLCVIAFCFVLCIPLNAQVRDAQSYAGKSYFGLTGSSLSGVGLMYQYNLTEKFSMKADGVWYLNKTERENKAYPGEKRRYTRNFWCAGGELQRTVASLGLGDADVVFYALIGGSYWYSKASYPYEVEDSFDKRYFAIGAGFGSRFILGSLLFVDASITYQFTRYTNSFKRYIGLGGGGSVGIIL
jgi:hypothetical protein